MNDKTFIIEVPRLFQNKIYKRLTFTARGLKIERTLSFEPIVFLPAENILSFRYGVKWIKGYAATFGRQYIIQIQDSEKKIFTIKLSSYYRIRSKAYHKIWSEIFSGLWNNYFIHIYNYYSDLYSIKQDFELSTVKFNKFGISWGGDGLFWNEIALSNYRTYFMIHHKDDFKKTHSCNFMNDWNAVVLQCLLKKIVEEHKGYSGL